MAGIVTTTLIPIGGINGFIQRSMDFNQFSGHLSILVTLVWA